MRHHLPWRVLLALLYVALWLTFFLIALGTLLILLHVLVLSAYSVCIFVAALVATIVLLLLRQTSKSVL